MTASYVILDMRTTKLRTHRQFERGLLMDVNVKAFRLVQAVTGEATDRKKQNKIAASRKGGLKGGAARAKAVPPERRVEIARNASQARWARNTP